MDKPFKAEDTPDQGTVNLYFKSDPVLGIPHRMRGAIQWPVGMIPGYCIIAGQDIKSRVLWIFEEYPFYSVGTISGEAGLWHFLGTAWKNYRCRRLFYAHQDTHLRYSLQVVREPLISNKPSFVEAELAKKGDENVDNLILEYQRLGRLKMDKEAKPMTQKHFAIGNLYDQLMVYAKGYTTNEDSLPAVIALRALVAGIERTPYRKPMPEERPKESYY